MKVLLMNGSPNEAGCTFTALSEAARILEEEGIETEIFQLGKKPIRGCIGCGGCVNKGRCVFDDDAVNRAIEKAEGADGYIIGSPVYFASANGALIALLPFLRIGGRFPANRFLLRNSAGRQYPIPRHSR